MRGNWGTLKSLRRATLPTSAELDLKIEIDFSSGRGVLIFGPRVRRLLRGATLFGLGNGRSKRRSASVCLVDANPIAEGDGDYRNYPGSRQQHLVAAKLRSE
jgi:hypothetical protein